MNSPSKNPHLSGPDEKPTCYRCEKTFNETPTVVSAGTPAGTVLEIPKGEVVEVCDGCMDIIADKATGE